MTHTLVPLAGVIVVFSICGYLLFCVLLELDIHLLDTLIVAAGGAYAAMYVPHRILQNSIAEPSDADDVDYTIRAQDGVPVAVGDTAHPRLVCSVASRRARPVETGRGENPFPTSFCIDTDRRRRCGGDGDEQVEVARNERVLTECIDTMREDSSVQTPNRGACARRTLGMDVVRTKLMTVLRAKWNRPPTLAMCEVCSDPANTRDADRRRGHRAWTVHTCVAECDGNDGEDKEEARGEKRPARTSEPRLRTLRPVWTSSAHTPAGYGRPVALTLQGLSRDMVSVDTAGGIGEQTAWWLTQQWATGVSFRVPRDPPADCCGTRVPIHGGCVQVALRANPQTVTLRDHANAALVPDGPFAPEDCKTFDVCMSLHRVASAHWRAATLMHTVCLRVPAVRIAYECAWVEHRRHHQQQHRWQPEPIRRLHALACALDLDADIDPDSIVHITYMGTMCLVPGSRSAASMSMYDLSTNLVLVDIALHAVPDAADNSMARLEILHAKSTRIVWSAADVPAVAADAANGFRNTCIYTMCTAADIGTIPPRHHFSPDLITFIIGVDHPTSPTHYVLLGTGLRMGIEHTNWILVPYENITGGVALDANTVLCMHKCRAASGRSVNVGVVYDTTTGRCLRAERLSHIDMSTVLCARSSITSYHGTLFHARARHSCLQDSPTEWQCMSWDPVAALPGALRTFADHAIAAASHTDSDVQSAVAVIGE